MTAGFRSALVAGFALVLAAALPAAASHVNVIKISGSINPASSDYIKSAIAQSEADGAVALVIELDTPGGLLASTKDIIQAILNSRAPVWSSSRRAGPGRRRPERSSPWRATWRPWRPGPASERRRR